MSGSAHFLRGSNLAGYTLGLMSVFSPLAMAQSQAPLDLSAISAEALRDDLRREILTRERMGLPPIGEDKKPSHAVVHNGAASSSLPCRKHDRRSLISYTSDDGALRSGVRLRRNQIAFEFNYAFDGEVQKLSSGDRCRPVPNWQGWGAIIYREVSGDKDEGRLIRDEIIRDADEERHRIGRGITPPTPQISAKPQ